MAEQLVLDPLAVSTGRQQLDITPWVKAEGADWGDGEMAAYMADQARGSTPVDFRLPNRQIVLPLVVKRVPAQPGAGPGGGPTIAWTYAQGRAVLQQKVARIQQEGGWIGRTTSSGTLFADVVNASLKFGGSWYQANKDFDQDAELHLECIPDWYGPEVQLADHVETVNGELIWTEINIQGNYPGRLRLVVDEDQGQSQMGLLFGIRCRHYSNSTTAQLKYEAETCTPLDAAGIGGGVVVHPNLSTSWTPVLSTHQTGGVALTHTGTYRVWARAFSSSVSSGFGLPYLRLVWDVGDFALPTENKPVRVPGNLALYGVDLGEVRLDRVPAGNHRWQGIIQGRSPDAGGGNVQIDKIWLVPVDEGYGVLRAPLTLEPGLQSFSARDEFSQAAGALAGKTAAVGGVWAGFGDTDDFVVEATGHSVQRTAVSDINLNTGRFALCGSTTFSTVAVQVDHRRSNATPNAWDGVLARYTDVNNWCLVAFTGTQSQFVTIQCRRLGATSFTQLAEIQPLTAGTLYSLRFWVDPFGNFAVWYALAGGSFGQPIMSGVSSELGVAGLASGRVGIYDTQTDSAANVRTFDNFAAWVPPQDAVLHPNQSAELRTEGMFREEATGAAFGPVSHVVGDLPRIPPSGAEGRTVQFFLKVSRGDFATLPDTGIDDMSARVSYRPSFIFVS